MKYNSLIALAFVTLLWSSCAKEEKTEETSSETSTISTETEEITTKESKALEVEKVTITVKDLEKSLAFYTTVLPFKELKRYEYSGKILSKLTGLDDEGLSVQIVELGIGKEIIALQEFQNEGRILEIPEDSKSNDLWFQHVAIVVSDMEAAYARLEKAGVEEVSRGPQTLPEYITAAAGIKAFYFRDPDDHNLEIIYYPEGKGNPKWQETNGELFLGIDHTAIGIKSTDKSTAFYENILGLKTLGHSQNYGPEQEALNNVDGAKLWISGLGAEKGFGVEFLEYQESENEGRPYPEDSKPTDLWHWQTRIEVADLQNVYSKLKEANGVIISSAVVSHNNKKELMVRDPDGHALLLVQEKF